MRWFLFGIAIAAFAFTPGTVAASPQPLNVRVGDGTLDGSFLQPYNNAWFYTAKLADGQVRPEGIWTDHMQRANAGGKEVLIRVQGITFLNGLSSSTINVFDPKTLAPISMEKHNLDGTIFKRTFNGSHVTSVTLKSPSDTSVPSTVELSEPVYDFNGGLYGILLAALPMKVGLSGSLPAVADSDDVLSMEPFEVLRQESIRAGSRGMVRAWVVKSVKPGNYTMTFWITKTPPYILRLVFDDTANRRVLTWEML